METQLYLDTARLGRMSCRAQQAHCDFARMAAEEGASSLFERFLREGMEACPESVQSRHPGLACWRGVSELKQSLRTLAGSDPELPLLMVNRSTQLMRFAGRLLFQRCRNVLVTDLGWPPYREILDQEARRARRRVAPLAVRDLLCDGKTSEDELIETVKARFLAADCDGLFLTAVSHLGVRLPVERLVKTLETARPLRIVVIDGAQDFCHVSADLSHEYCDLYLASCHKWLEGFHPMGLGFYGRRRSLARIETLLGHMLASGELDDPLLSFTSQLETGVLDGDTETVNLIPLFTCQGAATDAIERVDSLAAILQSRQDNLITAALLAESCGWQARLPTEPFRSGILLLQAERASIRRKTPSEIRGAFSKKGVALTAYNNGFVRLSMPPSEWQSKELDRLRDALRLVV